MMKEKYFITFSKRHILLYVLLLVTLVAPFIILLGAFTNWFTAWNQIKDFSAWASLTAGIMTYIGAVILGVIAYYNTWLKQYCEEKIKCTVDAPLFWKGELGQFFTIDEFYMQKPWFVLEYLDGEDDCHDKQYDFKRILIKNLNHNYPLTFSVKKVEISSTDFPQYLDCTKNIMVISNIPTSEPFDHSSPLEIFLGINHELFEKLKQPGSSMTLFNVKAIIQLSNQYNSEFLMCELSRNGNETSWHFLSKKEIKKINEGKPPHIYQIIDTNKD